MKNTLDASARRVSGLIAYFLCFCLVLVTLFITPHPIHAAAESGETAKAKVKSLAAKYTRAMSEIGRVAGMNLSSKPELHNALEILRRNDPDLKYITYRLIEIALENPALQKSAQDKLRAYLAASPTVQDKVKKAKVENGRQTKIDANEEVRAWINGLQKNPNTIRDWPGVSQAQQEINNQFRKDQEVLHRVAANLKRAAERKSASTTPGVEESGMTLRPVRASFAESFDSIEPTLPGQIEVIIGVIGIALIAVDVVVCSVGLVCSVLEREGNSCVNTDPGIELLPIGPTPYEKCKAECDKWRDDCIALARRVGNEDDEAMCWYRYYDDCLWSSCERLR